jgi:hypothetical protein
MPATDLTSATDEVRLYAARHGLAGFPEDQFARLAEIATMVRETGLAIPRMPSEEDEPAHLFTATPLRG